jgi:hypothetical protein
MQKEKSGLVVVAANWFTTGMVKDTDGQRLRRRPNVGVVGVGYILGSP